jgi:hypothetical protein
MDGSTDLICGTSGWQGRFGRRVARSHLAFRGLGLRESGILCGMCDLLPLLHQSPAGVASVSCWQSGRRSYVVLREILRNLRSTTSATRAGAAPCRHCGARSTFARALPGQRISVLVHEAGFQHFKRVKRKESKKGNVKSRAKSSTFLSHICTMFFRPAGICGESQSRAGEVFCVQIGLNPLSLL